MNDPIVEEVRKYRDDHARQFNYDMNQICADFMVSQGKSGHSVVRLKPRRMPTNASTATNQPALRTD